LFLHHLFRKPEATFRDDALTITEPVAALAPGAVIVQQDDLSEEDGRWPCHPFRQAMTRLDRRTIRSTP